MLFYARAVGAIQYLMCLGRKSPGKWRRFPMAVLLLPRQEVGNHSEKDMNSLGKFAFITPFPLKI